MTLSEYLDLTGLSVPALQKKLGIRTVDSVYKYLRGDHIPSPEVMARIFKATNGAVQPNDFYDLPKPARKKRATEGARA